jgi:hypothetical protein
MNLEQTFWGGVLALCGLNLRLAAGSFEHGNEPVGSVTTGSFLAVWATMTAP